jgi:hypothetical protein
MNPRRIEGDWAVSLFWNIGYTAGKWEKYGKRKREGMSSTNGCVKSYYLRC